MFVDLLVHYNHDLYGWDTSIFLQLLLLVVFYILMPHTDFNESQQTFHWVPGNTVLTPLEE